MTKAELLKLIQSELYKHDFDCFVDDPPSIAKGGKGVVVAGCPHGRKRLQSMNEFIEHLAQDALPKLFGVLETEQANAK